MGQRRAKLSISIPAEIVADLDRSVRSKRYRSRSAAIEAALQQWARKERDAEIEAYYAAETAEERRESIEWAELGYEALLLASEPPSPRYGAQRRRKHRKK